MRRATILGAVMITVAALGWWLALPLHLDAYKPQLDALIPKQIGDWVMIPTAGAIVDPTKEGDTTTDPDELYDEILMRSYRNSHGDIVQLALAYGRNQRQELKIHRPELCYTAAGFAVESNLPAKFAVANARGQPIDGARMVVSNGDQRQAVSYWIRIGTLYSINPWAVRKEIFKEGLAGRVDDGILVRASRSIGASRRGPTQEVQQQEVFLQDLVEMLPPRAKMLLAM